MADSNGLEAHFISLYLDRHIIRRLAVDLEGRGFDVERTEDASNDTATDDEQLSYAAANGRSILTFNIRDFAPLHDQWIAAGQSHAGIVVSKQYGTRQYGHFLRLMLNLLNNITAEEMLNNLVHLEQFE